MASPPLPPLWNQLGNQPFSFYPPIVNVEHNEWLFRKATWSEILVVNRRSGEEVWISRRFVGEVSIIDDPVLIVGLLRELEYREGAVIPCERRVIEMPVAVGAEKPRKLRRRERRAPAPVVGIRLERRRRPGLRYALMALAAVVAIALVVIGLKWA